MGCKFCSKYENLDIANEHTTILNKSDKNIINENKTHYLNKTSLYKFKASKMTNKGSVRESDRLKLKHNLRSNNSNINLIKKEIKQKLESINNDQTKIETKKLIESISYKGVQSISIFNIKNMSDIYERITSLGKGPFGEVYKVQHKDTKEIYALRAISKLIYTAVNNINEKINVLKSLKHPGVVSLIDYFEDDKFYYLINEFGSGGELINFVIKNNKINEQEVANIIKNIFLTLQYAHSINFIHSDLKPENVLVFDGVNQQIKISDFGIPILFKKNEDIEDILGAPYYKSPEFQEPNEKSDIWGCGVIMYILLSGNIPFSGFSVEEIVEKIKTSDTQFIQPIWRKVSSEAIKLLNKIFIVNTKNRISVSEALNDNWFVKFEQSKDKLYPNLDDSITNLKSFYGVNLFQRSSFVFLCNQIVAKKEESRLRKTFKELDLNGSGHLTIQEIITGFEKSGYSKKDAETEINKMMQYIEAKSNGKIDYNEFLEISLTKNNLFLDHKLHQSFDYFDKDKSGTISAIEIKEAFNGVFRKQKLEYILKHYDFDPSQEITYEEFKAMITEYIYTIPKEKNIY